MNDDVTRASKFLAYVLRHDPAAIGLALGEGGWVRIDALLAGAARHGRGLDAAMLHRVLNAPGKQRFETRDGLTCIGSGPASAGFLAGWGSVAMVWGRGPVCSLFPIAAGSCERRWRGKGRAAPA
jgi:RNA 2'-phosphotransferase, Tpt1 / KptA family